MRNGHDDYSRRLFTIDETVRKVFNETRSVGAAALRPAIEIAADSVKSFIDGCFKRSHRVETALSISRRRLSVLLESRRENYERLHD